nr:hypothetical protein [uncultured Cellulosilyticum sp.]
MDIKWSYYLIALIYVLVIVLRLINMGKATKFKEEHVSHLKFFTIKKDFFTTVTIICIVVTVAINGAALIGGKNLNMNSIIITLLVIGFTLINSFTSILLDEEGNKALFYGYTIEEGEIESLKAKEKSKKTIYDITFTKEVDSYNYAKLIVYGSNREKLKAAFEGFVKKEEVHNS